jgi:hypothetical protein
LRTEWLRTVRRGLRFRYARTHQSRKPPIVTTHIWNGMRDNEDRDDTVSTYRAHVDRPIVSMQRQDKRHSWYLLDSLIQQQGALGQTEIETPRPRARPISDRGISSADTRALLRQPETGDDGPSDNETKPRSSTFSAGDLAQRSIDPGTSATTRHQEPLVRPNDLIATAEVSPPLIPTRHPGRPSEIALGKRRAPTLTEHVEDKDVLNDSGVSLNL